jgi:hypothetical protein
MAARRSVSVSIGGGGWSAEKRETPVISWIQILVVALLFAISVVSAILIEVDPDRGTAGAVS